MIFAADIAFCLRPEALIVCLLMVVLLIPGWVLKVF